MWQKIGEAVLRYRLALLLSVTVITGVMAYYAAQVKMSYDFGRAIPTDHPEFQTYLSFKQTFGEDGNILAVGLQTDKLFEWKTFNRFISLHDSLKRIRGVDDVLSPVSAINLVRNDTTGRLSAVRIFPSVATNQFTMDSARAIFENLPFYRGLMYNPESGTYLLGVSISKYVLNSKTRDTVVADIEATTAAFEQETGIRLRYSGLPHIRTYMTTRINAEMRLFLLGSILFSALILFLFFRSFSTTVLSLAVVIIGVIWSLGTLQLFGFKITLLSALIPPLIVVIGIPNCIYFLNKYHTSYINRTDQRKALVEMVGKMGIVTLFCNIAAAIGFGVFALTSSVILKEFGIVAGINIMALFLISLIVIPAVLSYLPIPKEKHTRYLTNPWLTSILTNIEKWVFTHTRWVYAVTIALIIFSISGMVRLRSEGFVVDDLPSDDQVFTDLKFFETHFKGVIPLEIVVDSRKRNGLSGMRALTVFEQIDSLSRYITQRPDMARPLSLAEGLKFAKQGFYDGDSNNYVLPNAFDGAFVGEYLRPSKGNGNSDNAGFDRIMKSFIDSTRQKTRVSINMADVGSRRLPLILDTLRTLANSLFDTSKYSVSFTGTSVTFLEGSRFIINGLWESIFWAFLLISASMLYLFRSFRILVCSLIPNIIPLIMTAGVMGWMNIPLKPSTVLVFSVALGIAIDVTIRFLINYKQELPLRKGNVRETVMHTIRQTGISIIYTSLVLIAGFIIFVFSGFGGTQALGWLTSLTLLTATVTNLVLLPVLLIAFDNTPRYPINKG
ncbi:MAG: efflux RND transporter permease subunit [Chitinophagaceae bacterium]